MGSRGRHPPSEDWAGRGLHTKALFLMLFSEGAVRSRMIRHMDRIEVDKRFWESTRRKAYFLNNLRSREERVIKVVIGAIPRIRS